MRLQPICNKSNNTTNDIIAHKWVQLLFWMASVISFSHVFNIFEGVSVRYFVLASQNASFCCLAAYFIIAFLLAMVLSLVVSPGSKCVRCVCVDQRQLTGAVVHVFNSRAQSLCNPITVVFLLVNSSFGLKITRIVNTF